MPKKPEITLIEDDTQDDMGNSKLERNVTLQCVSRGGNPAPIVNWYRRHELTPLSSSLSIIHEDDDTFTVTRNVTFMATEEDHDVVLVCQSSLRTPPTLLQTNEVHLFVSGR